MAVNRERAKTRDPIELNIKYESLGKALVRIQDLITMYGTDTLIENTEERYDDYPQLYIYAERDETDAEMAKRIAQEENLEKMQKERDRRDYERLRAQFEGK